MFNGGNGNSTTIAIIGGGASGTITAINLLRTIKQPVKIFIVEKRQKFLFRGNAYSSQLEYEMLNVPAGKMSIFSNLPADFYNWLLANHQQQSETTITKDSFVSRRWFGDYITERLVEAKATARNASLEIIISEVSDIAFDKQTAQYQLRLENGTTLPANHLVFATGNESPTGVLNNLEKALLGNKYVPDPWSTNPFELLSPVDNVLIVGSGLSMVDHAVSLYKRKHKGKIYSFSRHGYLPLPQQIGKDDKVSFETGAQLLPLLHNLRTVIADSGKRGIDWQQIINSLRDDTPVIWQQLSAESKHKFLTRLKHFWEIHRHRIPAESAQAIEEMRATGKLQVLSGRYKEIAPGTENFVFRFTPRMQKDLKQIDINYVINCVGPSGNYRKGNNWLIRNLLAKGWMREDELQLGIVTGYKGAIITANGTNLLNAYAIGPLRKATEWESTAIREIKMQAEQVAQNVALSLSETGLTEGLRRAR